MRPANVWPNWVGDAVLGVLEPTPNSCGEGAVRPARVVGEGAVVARVCPSCDGDSGAARVWPNCVGVCGASMWPSCAGVPGVRGVVGVRGVCQVNGEIGVCGVCGVEGDRCDGERARVCW